MTHRRMPTQPPLSPRGELDGHSTARIARYHPPTPIDRAAADVVFRNNEEAWEARADGHGQIHSCVAPLPTLPRFFWPRDIVDLSGVTFGRMTVISLMAARRDMNKKAREGERGPRWCCRCSCGCYEARRATAIRNPRNVNDRCYECRKLDRLKAAERYRTTGLFTCVACGNVYGGGPCDHCSEDSR